MINARDFDATPFSNAKLIFKKSAHSIDILIRNWTLAYLDINLYIDLTINI